MRYMRTIILDAVHLRALAHRIYNRYKYLTDFHILSKNARFINQGAPDGLPLPSPLLVCLVSGHHDLETFYNSGLQGADDIRSTLERNGLNINAFESILDFGCGCGRIMRHWKRLYGPRLYGTDYNPFLVKWCQKNLAFAEFKINKLTQRLEYEEGKFDFIYAVSVFTHLTEDLQKFWINELKRIVRACGYILITVHGRNRLHQLTGKERYEFESGKLVMLGGKYPGNNICAAYHPEQYVRQSLAKGLTIVDFIAGGAKGSNQDIFLLRKSDKST